MTTYTKLNEQVKELINQVITPENIDHYIMRVENSGMVNIEDYEEHEYLIAKIVTSAIFKELSYQYRPHMPADRKLSEELYKYAL